MGFFGMALSYLLFSILHFFQFIMGLVVIGLYGTDLDAARKAGKYADGKWVFAVVVGALSALTSLLYSIPFILRFAAVPAWSFIIFVLWCAVFGLFGKMYIHENPEGNAGIQRMKNAVWVDLANLILWFIGTVAGAAYWWAHRERHSRFTGRANLGRNASVRSSGWRA
ncbi:hypothetical protein JX265_008220 [Neoarthrinium moseri]|uniref:Uncharacterized protein n=1 Tax=Neoarthrinium moseri TaxID=1658444 RepID=A0A9P9WIJ9_9PEZI|nr:uncharacterized protein JN550_004918 [Neoarthrinium moseri]KAI1851974.1 hypothetical protein JX266_002827 [Neoarthrinium moseri]KAI1865173.1 hypothetical protein JX265_008220 [Neoarthrinium moseri]KAI1870772.1 hypothetical protein JN550_004918 [Neoarthrinium moseri]